MQDISRAVRFPAMDHAASEENNLEHNGSISYNSNPNQKYYVVLFEALDRYMSLVH